MLASVRSSIEAGVLVEPLGGHVWFCWESDHQMATQREDRCVSMDWCSEQSSVNADQAFHASHVRSSIEAGVLVEPFVGACGSAGNLTTKTATHREDRCVSMGWCSEQHPSTLIKPSMLATVRSSHNAAIYPVLTEI